MHILGLATALPEFEVSQSLACHQASSLCGHSERQELVLAQMYKKTEIEKRAFVLGVKDFDLQTNSSLGLFGNSFGVNSAGPGTQQRMERYAAEAGLLALKSAKRALELANTSAESITHLLTVSCTGFSAPGFDLQLLKSLGLSSSVYRTHLGFMGCHGALNALRVAEGFCFADENASVLLTATELCSLHFQYEWQSDNIVANSLFADGSASLVLSRFSSDSNSRRSSLKSPKYVSSKSFVIPDSEDIMSWTITNNGFKMVLGSALPELVDKHIDEFICQWLGENGLGKADISGWAVHPGGPRILNTVEQALGLGSDKLECSRRILSSCGNMSSPTVLFILEELQKRDTSPPFVVLGFGPGITIEAALFV